MKRLCVVGTHIAHSVSPQMHNAALADLGLSREYHYDRNPMRPKDVQQLIDDIADGQITGANITAPLKEVIVPFIDRIGGDAVQTSSVNTLYSHKGMVVGCSTDGVGFIKSLQESRIDIPSTRCIVIGAGGAARSICHSLLKHDVPNLFILNRNVERARDLARVLRSGGNASVVSGRLEEFPNYVRHSDMVINCTPLGMRGVYENESPVTDSELMNGLSVMDLNYNPPRTKLLAMAEDEGCRTINGVMMLVHQGAESLRIWTGREPSIGVMRAAALAAIDEQGRSHEKGRVRKS